MPSPVTPPAWLRDPAIAVLVLSPHLDDAVFSTWSLLSARPCQVWTVFAGRPDPAQTTAWDQACGFADSDQTLTARLAEDQSALGSVATTVRHLPYLDGPYTDPTRRRADLSDLSDRVHQWWRDHPDGMVVAPAGAGARVPDPWWQTAITSARQLASQMGRRDQRGIADPAALLRRLLHADYLRRRRAAQRRGLAVNSDHLAVRGVVLALALRDRRRVALYEDLPYLWTEPADAEVASLSDWTNAPWSLPVDQGAKFAACQHYASQVEVMDPQHRRLVRFGQLPEVERYWCLSPRGERRP